MNILVMGGPDVGEGTISAETVEKFNVNHISTGDIFRSEIEKGTALGMEAKSFMDKELLVPDEVVSNMVKSYLEKLEGKRNGFLLGGYPRVLDQARTFDALAKDSRLTIDKVITLKIDFKRLASRVTGRRICKGYGEIYHIKSEPSKTGNVCDVCGGELFQHKDDTVGSLTVCLEEYSSQTTPVFDYYDSKGIVIGVDASQPISSIWNDTLTALEKWEWREPKQIKS